MLGRLFDGGDTGPERLARRIARAGIASRRQAEVLIREGRVTINGQLQVSPAINIAADDDIRIDGTALPATDLPRLWRYYKPRGLVVSNRDEKGRKTVFDTLPATMPRVVSIGRLDLDSEGLLLLTNAGDLARYLELPATGWTRKYRVRVHGLVDPEKLAALAQGITIEGVHYRSIAARLDRQGPSNAWLSIALKEGKNREIRRVMEYLGYPVSRLIRTGFGPFGLEKLEEGMALEVRHATLRDQLGLPAAKPVKPVKPAVSPSKTEAKPTAKRATKRPAKPAARNTRRR